jgi:pimeloyl-ACP methyl ester carboxylesterase
MNVYFISGLGADERAFQNIYLPSNYIIHHLNWIEPLENESIFDYGIRLTQNIDKRKPFILIGLSFGGMIVSSICEQLKPYKAIVISSAKCSKELPFYFRLIGFLNLNKLFPYRLLKKTNILFYYLFGVSTKEERQLLDQIFEQTELNFLKWSINQIVNWNKKSFSPSLFHIHGTKDRILFYKKVNANYTIKGGEHFMIFSKASEVNTILNRIIESH